MPEPDHQQWMAIARRAVLLTLRMPEGVREWDHLCEELEAAALVGVWHAWQTFDPRRARWNTHARNQARFACLDYLRENGPVRRSGHARPETNYFTGRWGPTDPVAQPPEPRGEDLVLPRRYLRGLSKVERKILLQRFEQGKSQNEIARAIGVSESRVSQILKATLVHLRDRLERVAS